MNKKKIGIIVGVAVILIVVVAIILFSKDNSIKYQVVVDAGTLNTINVQKSRDRKNEIIKQKDSYYLVIHEAEQNKYYTLEVQSVSTTKDSLKVVVKKVAGVLDTKSNPKAVIKLEKKPKNIEIIYR